MADSLKLSRNWLINQGVCLLPDVCYCHSYQWSFVLTAGLVQMLYMIIVSVSKVLSHFMACSIWCFRTLLFRRRFHPKKRRPTTAIIKEKGGKTNFFFFPSSISRKIFPLLLESTTHVESFRDQHTHSHHFKKENYYSFTRSSITNGLFWFRSIFCIYLSVTRLWTLLWPSKHLTNSYPGGNNYFLSRKIGSLSHVAMFFFHEWSELKNTQHDFKKFNFECRMAFFTRFGGKSTFSPTSIEKLYV